LQNESLNSDGQPFHQCQLIEHKQTTTYDVKNTGSILRHK